MEGIRYTSCLVNECLLANLARSLNLKLKMNMTGDKMEPPLPFFSGFHGISSSQALQHKDVQALECRHDYEQYLECCAGCNVTDSFRCREAQCPPKTEEERQSNGIPELLPELAALALLCGQCLLFAVSIYEKPHDNHKNDQVEGIDYQKRSE